MLSVQRAGRYWIVLGPSEQTRGYFRTKREAVASLLDYEVQDRRNNRLWLMSETGIWTFTEEEQAEIDKLAEALRTHATRRMFGEEKTIEAVSRKEQVSDARTIASWHASEPISEHGKLVCAELRFRMQARAKAFKQAGLTL